VGKKVQIGDRVYIKAFPYRGHTGVVKDTYRLKSTLGLQRLYVVILDEASAVGGGLVKVSRSGMRLEQED
jgi:hypothetical protein